MDEANFYASISLDGEAASQQPTLAGTFSDWKERRMLPIGDFCSRLMLAQTGALNLKALISRSQQKKLGIRQLGQLGL